MRTISIDGARSSATPSLEHGVPDVDTLFSQEQRQHATSTSTDTTSSRKYSHEKFVGFGNVSSDAGGYAYVECVTIPYGMVSR